MLCSVISYAFFFAMRSHMGWLSSLFLCCRNIIVCNLVNHTSLKLFPVGSHLLKFKAIIELVIYFQILVRKNNSFMAGFHSFMQFLHNIPLSHYFYCYTLIANDISTFASFYKVVHWSSSSHTVSLKIREVHSRRSLAQKHV